MTKRILALVVLALFLACTSNPVGTDYPTDGSQKNPPPPTILQETLDVAPDSLSNRGL